MLCYWDSIIWSLIIVCSIYDVSKVQIDQRYRVLNREHDESEKRKHSLARRLRECKLKLLNLSISLRAILHVGLS